MIGLGKEPAACRRPGESGPPRRQAIELRAFEPSGSRVGSDSPLFRQGC